MKTIPNALLINPFTDKPYPVINEIGEAQSGTSQTLADAVVSFIQLGFRNPPPSFDDTEMGIRILRRMKEYRNNDTKQIEFEDADYKWLATQFKDRGPGIFGVNAYVIYEALMDVVHEGKVTHLDRHRKTCV